MRYTHDLKKRAANLKKHGYDFKDAPQVIVGFLEDEAVILTQEEIVRVFAEGGKVFAETSGGQFLLRLRLYELEEERKLAEQEGLGGDKKEIAWGSQIRSYVLQPYRLIKDHRTDHEMGNVDAVLDGYLDSFIKAYLLWRN